MPIATINNVDLHYTDTGEVHSKQTIIFCHGLLWSGDMFKPQIELLKQDYRCIAPDFRGQGQSSVSADGYDMDTLTLDIIALLDHLNLDCVHVVGLSMGGFVGMRMAIRHPERLMSLTLLETSADPEDRFNAIKYRLLAFIARWFGLGIVRKSAMDVMFGKTFLNDPSRKKIKQQLGDKLVANDRIGSTRATLGVCDRDGVYDQLPTIKTPTLILVGDEDVATPPAKSQRMHGRIAGSQLKIIKSGGHTSTLEMPDQVNVFLQEFLSGLSKT